MLPASVNPSKFFVFLWNHVKHSGPTFLCFGMTSIFHWTSFVSSRSLWNTSACHLPQLTASENPFFPRRVNLNGENANNVIVRLRERDIIDVSICRNVSCVKVHLPGRKWILIKSAVKIHFPWKLSKQSSVHQSMSRRDRRKLIRCGKSGFLTGEVLNGVLDTFSKNQSLDTGQHRHQPMTPDEQMDQFFNHVPGWQPQFLHHVRSPCVSHKSIGFGSQKQIEGLLDSRQCP